MSNDSIVRHECKSDKKHKTCACRMATPSSIKNRANIISDPMEQDRSNLQVKHNKYKG